jgi:serine protease AprX
VVSGAVALLLQARPNLTPNQVKALLTATDKPVAGAPSPTGTIDVERALYTPTTNVPAVNVRLVPNLLIDAANRAGVDISTWTRSTWSSAPGQFSSSWARSTWSCGTCTAVGGAIDPQRSTWSRSTWSSAGEDASVEAAQYAEAVVAAEETGSLDAPVPTDIPVDAPETVQ